MVRTILYLEPGCGEVSKWGSAYRYQISILLCVCGGGGGQSGQEGQRVLPPCCEIFLVRTLQWACDVTLSRESSNDSF